jgi:hypothetical protein
MRASFSWLACPPGGACEALREHSPGYRPSPPVVTLQEIAWRWPSRPLAITRAARRALMPL